MLFRSGNVKLALKLLRHLQKMGIVPAEYDIDRFEKELEREGVIRWDGTGPNLTRKGERALRRDAFEQVFEHLKRSGPGDHKTAFGGGDSAEQLEEKRPYVYGDDLASLDLTGSLYNSIIHSGSLGLNLSEDDLEVRDTAMNTSTATVVLLDISHSMILYGEDRITPAKQVAMAFAEMIMT